MAPRFEVDPLWPKRLPNHWVLGQVIGVDRGRAGSRLDRASRQPARRQRSRRQPESADGLVLREGAARPRVRSRRQRRRPLGRPAEGYDWPESNHGITVDHKGNVWIGANVGTDAHVLKFTRAGKFLMQFGKPGQNKGSNDTENFGRPAKIFVDAKANEAYIADGYGNKRVVVIDADTGQVQALLGRVRQQAGRHEPRQLRSEGAADQSSSGRRCTARICRTTGSSTSATGRTIASRSSSRTARS